MAAGVAALQAYENEGIVRARARHRVVAARRTSARWPKSAIAIGEVRGIGAFFGIELVTDRETREPLVAWQGQKTLAAFYRRSAQARPLRLRPLQRDRRRAAAGDFRSGDRRSAAKILDEAFGTRMTTYSRLPSASPSLDPATSRTLGHVPAATREECARAVAAAAAAFAAWSAVPVVERARLMLRYAGALERRWEDLRDFRLARERQDHRRRARRGAPRHRSRSSSPAACRR